MGRVDLISAEGLDLKSLVAATRQMPADAAMVLLAPRVADWQVWDWALLRELMARAEAAAENFSPTWLESGSPWRNSVTGRWLLADAWTRTGKIAEALAVWDEVIAAGGEGRAEALLARARLRRDNGDLAGALTDLRAAAHHSRERTTLTSAARLLERLAAKTPVPGLPIKIAVLFSSSTDLLVPLLRIGTFREWLNASIYVAAYGNIRQEVLDPQSGLYQFAPDVVILGTHWRDANFAAVAKPGDTSIDDIWSELALLWQTLQERTRCVILQHSFDQPGDEPLGYLAGVEPSGRRRKLRALNARLWAERPNGVVIVDLEMLAGECGAAKWHAAGQWFSARQHPGPDAQPQLVDQYVALIRARLGLAKKVVVFDLDNTLWGGVVGEDEVGGIQIGPPGAVGEAYAALQSYAKGLKERGILLAVCSKNNDADARAPFQQHDGMILKEADFAAFVANWNDKTENLRQIARGLNLGVDSLVFVDDNPVECERVRRELPEVGVVELSGDPAGFVDRLHGTGWFESLALSDEDRTRHQSYVANLERERARGQAGSMDEFLRKLAMRMQHGPVSGKVLDRVVQLLGKTNQFNLTSRRHSAAQVQAMIEAGAWMEYYRLTDCYGDNGIVGVLIATRGPGSETWEIDTFLMSCRVIGRRVENYMLRRLLLAAKAAGCTRVSGVYRPTAKNALAAEVYAKFGFAPAGEDETGTRTFIWDVVAQTIPEIPFIEPEATTQPVNA